MPSSPGTTIDTPKQAAAPEPPLSAAARARPRTALGIYLGVVQFFFACGWIVYVVYLPQLVEQAGLAKTATAWILMADQLVFVFADYAAGVAADRIGRAMGRIGAAVVAATLVSAAAFLALPHVAAAGSATALLVLIAVWALTSSALRAPPLALLARHVAAPRRPLLVGLSLLGLGVANAAAPYLGLHLRGVDPRLPFALASIALALTTCGLVRAERSLRRTEDAATAATPDAAGPRPKTTWFFAAALLAALAFQVHVFIDSTPLYRAHATAAELPLLTPVFWIGFNLAMLPFALAVRRWPAARVMAAAAFVAATASVLAMTAAALAVLVAAQLVAGAAWAGLVAAAFAWALERGGAGRAGTFAGALSAVLALAALARMASVAAGWPQSATFAAALSWWPVAGWFAASAGLIVLIARRKREPM